MNFRVLSLLQIDIDVPATGIDTFDIFGDLISKHANTKNNMILLLLTMVLWMDTLILLTKDEKRYH